MTEWEIGLLLSPKFRSPKLLPPIYVREVPILENPQFPFIDVASKNGNSHHRHRAQRFNSGVGRHIDKRIIIFGFHMPRTEGKAIRGL